MGKRKRDIAFQMNATIEDVKLKVSVPHSLPCEICGKAVFDYRNNKDVTCSYDCHSVLVLSKQNRMLHEEDKTTFEPMKE